MENHYMNCNHFNWQSSTVQLLYATKQLAHAQNKKTLHTHCNLEIFYITKGSGNFLIENQTFAMKKGDFVILNPHTLHSVHSSSKRPFEYIAIGISNLTIQFGKSAHYASPQYLVCNNSNHTAAFEPYLIALLQELEHQHHEYETACHCMIQLLIVHIQRQFQATLDFTDQSAIRKECRMVYEYINEHFTERITLEQLADYVSMNKFYISHEFKKSYGISPVNYLIKRRIEESKSLLAKTDHSLASIASLLGFSSASYFSQIFKRAEKMTPSQYRTQARKKSSLL
ncbi:MAG: AraC family transcriptional regulator [Eubacteriales bacterium]